MSGASCAARIAVWACRTISASSDSGLICGCLVRRYGPGMGVEHAARRGEASWTCTCCSSGPLRSLRTRSSARPSQCAAYWRAQARTLRSPPTPQERRCCRGDASSSILRKSRAISLVLGYIFLLNCYRARCVTAFASNFYLIRPSFPAKVATVFFAGGHHTTAWNVRTGALLRVIHQFLSKFIVNEKDSLMPMPACPPQVPNW